MRLTLSLIALLVLSSAYSQAELYQRGKPMADLPVSLRSTEVIYARNENIEGNQPAVGQCNNGVQDGDETGVDCGGTACDPCPTCADGIQNQGETGVDCGGPCSACPTCNDGIQNQGETGVDCGGPNCQDCAASPTCSDGIQNGTETGIDCGGSCDPCPSPNTCFDGVQNGTETGIDCGGGCPPCEGAGNPNYFPSSPGVTEPADGTTYTPTSAADLSNPANAGKTAIISNFFNASGTTLAANQKIRPAGGAISGANINLNGAYIDDVLAQAFSSNVTFTSVYDKSWVYPEVFGAVGNNAGDDSAGIQAVMNQCKFTRLRFGANYIINSPVLVDRIGKAENQTIVDMNFGKFEVTSKANYPLNDRYAMFGFANSGIKMYNGEITANDNFGNAFKLFTPEAYHFEDLWIHALTITDAEIQGLPAGGNVRASAIKIEGTTRANHTYYFAFYPGRTGSTKFKNGYMVNCLIEDVYVGTDFSPGNAVGVSKGFWLIYEDIDPTWAAEGYHYGNVIRNIEGDDAEGYYFDDSTFFQAGGKVDDHPWWMIIESDSVYYCGRRAIKSTGASLKVTNSYFESIPDDRSRGGGYEGGLVTFFSQLHSTYPTQRTRNIIFNNNVCIDRGVIRENVIAMQSMADSQFIGNIVYNDPASGNYGWRLGHGGGAGDFENVTISGNTLYNVFFNINAGFTSDKATFLISNNTINITANSSGTYKAAFRANNSSTTLEHLMVDGLTVNLNLNTGGATWGGLYASKSSARLNDSSFKNITINVTGAALTYPLGDCQGGVASDVTVENLLLNGAPGTNAWRIANTAFDTPTLTNARDDQGNPITIRN